MERNMHSYKLNTHKYAHVTHTGGSNKESDSKEALMERKPSFMSRSMANLGSLSFVGANPIAKELENVQVQCVDCISQIKRQSCLTSRTGVVGVCACESLSSIHSHSHMPFL